MKVSGAKRVKAKIAAREWIVAAIQNHKSIPEKNAEREIRRFVGRIQRDLAQLKKAEIAADLAIQGAERHERFKHATD